MTATRSPARQASDRFFAGVGRLRRSSEARCIHTLPLFPLALILEADGTLARDCLHLIRPENHPPPA